MPARSASSYTKARTAVSSQRLSCVTLLISFNQMLCDSERAWLVRNLDGPRSGYYDADGPSALCTGSGREGED